MQEPGLESLITVAEAAAIIDGIPVTPRQEVVALSDAAGRRLAEEVVTDRDYPPFDKSQMDGFAARVGEPAGEFELVGEVPAGSTWEGPPLRGRQAVAIMTGAPVPDADGAVGVVPVEQAERIDGGRVRLLVDPAPDRYIARRGSDRETGAVVLRAGARLTPAAIGVLASVGRQEACVFGAPRCAVLATGDELVAPGAAPAAHQIRNSNTPTLLALLAGCGCDAVDGGRVPDTLEATRQHLAEWLGSTSDCLFITGGMSMGEHDYVPRVLAELGVEMHVTKLKIKPGKPFLFGTRARGGGFVAGAPGASGGGAARGRHTTYVFGLPGNPVSAYVCTLVLAHRLLVRLAGGEAREADARFIERPLARPLGANGPRQFYQPVALTPEGVVPMGWRGSADVFGLAEADALLERPADDPPRRAGEVVRLLPLPS